VHTDGLRGAMVLGEKTKREALSSVRFVARDRKKRRGGVHSDSNSVLHASAKEKKRKGKRRERRKARPAGIQAFSSGQEGKGEKKGRRATTDAKGVGRAASRGTKDSKNKGRKKPQNF